MPLSQESWNQILRAVMHKAAEAGTTDPAALFDVMRDNWDLLCDRPRLVAYLATKELAAKRAQRDRLLQDAAALNTEIEGLEP